MPRKDSSLEMSVEPQGAIALEQKCHADFAKWITDAINLERDGKTEQSLDVIFDHIDDLLLASKFEECASALDAIPVEQMTNAQLITALTATAPAQDRISTRRNFSYRVEAALRNRGANAGALLSGLL